MGIFSFLNPARSPARPGEWFGDYHAAWNAAHPGAWANGTGKNGSFYKGDVWVTGTPDFDRQWFGSRGMGMPRRWRQADLSVRPGEVRLVSALAPAESIAVTVDTETGEVKNLGVRGGEPG